MSAAARPPSRLRSGSPASGRRSLKTNILFAVGGMGVFYACQFGVIILLAKFAPDEVLGQVQFSLAVATPLVVFCSLELRGALVADATNEFSFGTYRALRRFTMVIVGAVLLGVSLWEYAAERNAALAVIFAGMCASKIVLMLADIGWGLFQKRERLDLMAGSAALRGLTMIVAFGLFVPLYFTLQRRGVISVDQMPHGAAIAVTLYVLGSVTLLLAFDRRRVTARTDYDPTWTWTLVRRLAQQTFPLGVVLLMLHLCNSIPQLAIEQQAGGKAALGHFGALATVTLAGNLFVLQAANAAANRLSSYYQTDFAAFVRLAGKLLGLAVAVGLFALVVTLLFGEWLLRVLYRAEYAGYYDEFRIIVVAQCLALMTNVFGVMVTQMRLFWLQVPAQVIVLATTIIATLLLIPQAENLVRGGAWTMLVRASVHVALYAGCVLTGMLLRPRFLRRRVRPSPGPEDTLQNW